MCTVAGAGAVPAAHAAARYLAGEAAAARVASCLDASGRHARRTAERIIVNRTAGSGGSRAVLSLDRTQHAGLLAEKFGELKTRTCTGFFVFALEVNKIYLGPIHGRG